MTSPSRADGLVRALVEQVGPRTLSRDVGDDRRCWDRRSRPGSVDDPPPKMNPGGPGSTATRLVGGPAAGSRKPSISSAGEVAELPGVSSWPATASWSRREERPTAEGAGRAGRREPARDRHVDDRPGDRELGERRAAAPPRGAQAGAADRAAPSPAGHATPGHPVADAAHGLDWSPPSAQLPAQERDKGVDRVRGHGDAERPGQVEQLVAAQRVAGVAEEALEQRELARRQIDGAAVDRHQSSGFVERDGPADAQNQRPAGAADARRASARSLAESSS